MIAARLWPAAAVRLEVLPCPCDRSCGGWRLEYTPTDDRGTFPQVFTQTFEHLSRSELMDVMDVAVDACLVGP